MQEEMDPVMEVMLWQEKNRIQERIRSRMKDPLPKQKADRDKKKDMDVVENEAEVEATPISLVTDDDDSEWEAEARTMLPDAIPVATHVTYSSPKDPIVPKTIQNLWKRIEEMPHGALEPPRCKCKQCPYNSGYRFVPLMQQRYDLMQRLVELERQLYGI